MNSGDNKKAAIAMQRIVLGPSRHTDPVTSRGAVDRVSVLGAPKNGTVLIVGYRADIPDNGVDERVQVVQDAA